MSTLPPWHMWGDRRPLVVTPANASASTDQVARISYARPESWRFLLGYKIQACNLTGPDGGPVLVLSFDLTIGVGRSPVTLEGFAKFTIVAPAAGPTVWTTQVPGGPLGGDAATVLCDVIPSQDLQLQAHAIVTNVTGGTQCAVDVFGFFSPATHVRPEWFEPNASGAPGVKRFAGDEYRGR